MTERIFVYALKIPDVGSFLLVSHEFLGSMESEEESFQKMFDNNEITITIPDDSTVYKEIEVENVWGGDNEKAIAFKWSRNGIAVLYRGFWKNKNEMLREKESFLKIFNS